MSFDASAAMAAMPPEMLQPQMQLQPQQIDVGYNATLGQAVQFQNLLHVSPVAAPPPTGPTEPTGVMKTMMGALEQVNGQASDISAMAQQAENSGAGMTPGECFHVVHAEIVVGGHPRHQSLDAVLWTTPRPAATPRGDLALAYAEC